MTKKASKNVEGLSGDLSFSLCEMIKSWTRCFASDKYLALMNEHQETDSDTKIDVMSPKISDNKKPREKTREKTREKILALIRENNKITTHELAEALSLTDKGVEWQLKQLKDKKVIIRVGADKGGYWEIVQGVDK